MTVFKNAKTHLITPTHDGSGQTVHPKLIDFKLEHGMETWHGYRYWLAHSPLPYSSNVHEDPNILCSKDGKEWVVPNGITNPLDDAEGGSIFCSDPDMIYVEETDTLWLYYRLTDGIRLKEYNKIVYITYDESLGKFKASEPDIILNIAWDGTSSDIRDRSFAHWRESPTKWHRWVNYEYKLYYCFSSDGKNWGEISPCLNSNGKDPFQAISRPLWHLEVRPNKREKRIEFLSYCNTNGEYLNYAECSMDNLKLVNALKDDLITGSGVEGQWDSYGLYKSTFVIEDIEDSYLYHLYYIGSYIDSNKKTNYHMGYTSAIIPNKYTKFLIKPYSKLLKVGDKSTVMIVDGKNYTFNIGDTSIISVSSVGEITALKTGVTYMEAIDENGVLSNKIWVTVTSSNWKDTLKIFVTKTEAIEIPLYENLNDGLVINTPNGKRYAKINDVVKSGIPNLRIKLNNAIKSIALYD